MANLKKYAKMRMASGGRGGNQYGRNEMRNNRSEMNMTYPRMGGGNMEMRGNYGEARFRDRRGREHYDNGRFAPRGAMDGYDGMESRVGYDGEPENRRRYRRTSDGRFRSGMDDMEDAYPGYVPPVWERGGEMNTIGFNANREMESNYRTDAGYYPRSEMESSKGEMSGGHASSKGMPMTKEIAEEWTKNLHNEDGSKGPHWSMEQVKQVMAQKGVHAEPYEFFAVINALYSDYCAVLKKYGLNKMDVYVDLASAWINDADAVKNKAVAYYENIVK